MPASAPPAIEPLEFPSRFPSLTTRLRHVADARPDELALTDGDDRRTFRALQADVDRLARLLAGALPAGDEPVGILLPHGAALIVTLLALMRIDRVLVVLDPAAPADRIADLVATSGMRALVTDGVTGTASEGLLVVVDDGSDPGTDLPDPVRGGADAAFIVFTSGSTGRPKGVVETHEAMLLECAVFGSTGAEIGPGDRLSMLFPMAFLGGPVSLFGGLLNGASVHLFDARTSTPRLILDFVRREAITMLGFAPFLLRASVDALAPGEVLPSVRLLATGGEGIMGEDVEAFRAHLPADSAYLNGVGSSEAPGFLSYHVPAGVALPPGTVPAGSPQPQRELRILREDGSDAEAGEVGQIMVVADVLSGGYWRNDAANAARFGVLPDGRRTYLTGDLGRLDEQGRYRLVGRADRAVKIRGYLVDVSEVEDALRRNRTVADVLVVPDAPDGGPVRLVAYVVHRPQVLPDSVADLRRALRAALPEYMVPGAILPLPALPRNERGKVDRARLPQPPAVEVDDTGWTQHQLVVGGIWANVLGLDKVPLDGDFLALGGDSLSVEEMLAEIALRYDLGLASTDLLAAPTLAEFTALVEQRGGRRAASPDIAHLRVDDPARTVFCFAGAGALAMQFLPLARHLEGWDVWGVQAHALERRGLPDWTLPAQARRAVADLQAVQPDGPVRLVGHSFGGILVLEVARLLRAAGREVELVVAIDTFLTAEEGERQRWEQLEAPGRRIAPRAAIRMRERAGRRLALRRAHETTVQTWLGRVVRSLLAGVVRFDGQDHFDAFQRRSIGIARRARPRPFDGRALVVSARADSEEWRTLLTGDVTVAVVEGEHSAILREPIVARVAEVVAAALAGAPADVPVDVLA